LQEIRIGSHSILGKKKSWAHNFYKILMFYPKIQLELPLCNAGNVVLVGEVVHEALSVEPSYL